jgi:hypothetical protein
MRSLLAISFKQNQKTIFVARSTWNHIWRFPLTRAEIWDPFWQPPLTKAEIRDPFWRSPLIKSEIWDPFWRPPLTKTEIWDLFWRPPLSKTKNYICSSVNLESHLVIPFTQSWNRCPSSWWQGLNLSFSFKNFLIGSPHFIVVPNSMILSSSTILLN